MNKGKPVAVVVGATSKWRSDGPNTRLAHGKALAAPVREQGGDGIVVEPDLSRRESLTGAFATIRREAFPAKPEY